MSSSRIKTMVIIALLLINIFFIAVIIVDIIPDVRSERQVTENICAVLRRNGISLNPEDIITNGALRTMRVVRRDEAEEAIAHAFLGAAEMTDQVVIYIYENTERGKAEFFTAGDFEINLNEGVITSAGGTLRTVQRLLKDMKLETTEPVLTGVSDNETVTAVCMYKGARIFNCTVEFVFRKGSLVTVAGRYAAGIETIDGETEVSSAGTALLGFLAWVKKESVDCAHISSVEAGYQHRVADSFGGSVIAPVWLITADSGRYILDGATGEVWPLSG